MVENPLLVEKGCWPIKNVIIQKIIEDRNSIIISEVDRGMIDANWLGILAKNPKAFAGATVRLAQSHTIDDKLILEVLPSDYKEGCLLNWLGAAMIPVTSDGYVALQAPVATIAATVGGGIRVPGCTPPHADFSSHIVKEIKEEFNVDINEEQIIVLGLARVIPPLAKFHYGLISMVLLKETFEELEIKWQGAEDKWEGELLSLKLNKDNLEMVILNENNKYGPVTPLALQLIFENIK